MNRFAQYHGCAITVSDAAANEKVGGRHPLDDLDGFLAGIESGFAGIKVYRDGSGAVSIR
jgi:ferric-dicitrate binding protein FerR (iron transport regulator)